MAALLAALLLVTSMMLRRYATYVYADQTLTLLSLIAFAVYFWRPEMPSPRRLLAVGVITSVAVFAKGLGAATALFFIAHVAGSAGSVRQAMPRLATLAAGGLAGIALVALLFVALFGVGSVKSLFIGLTVHNFQMISVGGAFGNLVSYVPAITTIELLPVLAAPFVLASAFGNVESRRPLLLALSHFLTLGTLYALTSRGGHAIQNYLYPTFVFAALGTAIHLGRQYSLATEATARTARMIALAVPVVLVVAALVRAQAVKVAPPEWFTVGTRFAGPYLIQAFALLGAMALLVLMTTIEAIRRAPVIRARLIAVFAILVAAWCEVVAAGTGMIRMRQERTWSNTYYDAARTLAAVDAPRYRVHVKRWERLEWVRVQMVYVAFYGRPQGRSVTALTPHALQQVVFRDLTPVTTVQLPTLKSGDLVLTDQLDEITQRFEVSPVAIAAKLPAPLTLVRLVNPR